MTERQEKKLNMYLAILDVCERHRHVWRELSAFANAYREFSARVETLRGLSGKQSRHTGGVADDKRQLRQQMCVAAYEIAAATRACALAVQRAEMAQSIDFSLTDLRIGKDVLCVKKCQLILRAAQELLPVMAGYGITEEKIAGLQNVIGEFETILNKPRQIRDANKEITAGLPVEFKAADDLLYNHLDGLLPQFRISHARFYETFQESRKMTRQTPQPVHIRPSYEGTLD